MKVISLVIIFIFTSTNVAPVQPFKYASYCRGINLSPQYSSKPIEDISVQEKSRLGLIILEAVTRRPELLAAETIQDMAMGEYVVRFSSIEPVAIKSGLAAEESANLFFIPCYVAEKLFYAYLVRYADGRSKIAVMTEKEYESSYKEITDSKAIDPETASRLKEDLSPGSLRESGPDMCFLDKTDPSVGMLSRFLEKAGTVNLKKKLETLLGQRLLFTVQGPALVSRGIVVDSSKEPESRAISILSRILIDSGASYLRVVGAFSEFLKDENSFDLDVFDPELNVFLRELDKSLGSPVSNEGNIRFSDRAYGEMMIPFTIVKGRRVEVKLEDCQEVVHDIIRVFKKVIKHEMEDYNKTAPEGRKITIKDMPGRRIVVEHISDCLLPTLIEDKDGTIRINELVVKTLRVALDKGVFTRMGNMKSFHGQGERGEDIGNFYESLLYSLALHSIRGHFRINEYGFAVFNPDESWAQGERGRSHLYPNILAMLTWWFVAVDHGVDLRERVKLFIEENPEVFRHLSDEERERLPEHVGQLDWHMMRDGVSLGSMYDRKTGMDYLDYGRIVREGRYVKPYPKKEKPERNDVSGGETEDSGKSAQRGEEAATEAEILELLSVEGRPFTMAEIAADLDYQQPGDVLIPLVRLVELGVVDDAGIRDEQPLFQALPLKVDDVRSIQGVLDENELFGLDTDNMKVKGEVYKRTE
ncbi:MAG: hypothetical protein WBB84_01875, partial [Candidatus Omnitrophota bacterium]